MNSTNYTSYSRPAKVRRINLPDEYNLERLIEKVNDRHKTWITNISACKWEGLTCTKRGEITSIQWSGISMGGCLQWKYLTFLPQNFIHLDVSDCRLSGEVEFHNFPHQFRYGRLEKNKFYGTLDVTRLPCNLKDFYLNCNAFEGSVDLTRLPCTLTSLSLRRNRFSGTLDFSALPSRLHTLDLSNNRFTGQPNLSFLPSALLRLNLSKNTLEGHVDVSYLNRSLRLKLERNVHLHID